MSLEKVLYQAHAKVTGGRNGRAVTSDGALEVKLTTPKEMGGPGGEGSNPEQLFAAGYAACFLGALKLVAGQKNISVPADAAINSTVGFGKTSSGFGIEVDLQVSLPGMDKAQADELIQAAHQVCPYSHATRNNIDVRLSAI
jgi:Ohr subfamily peroxiredoxin